MPYTFRFLLVVCLIGGFAYAAFWALAHFPPPQHEVTKLIVKQPENQADGQSAKP